MTPMRNQELHSLLRPWTREQLLSITVKVVPDTARNKLNTEQLEMWTTFCV